MNIIISNPGNPTRLAIEIAASAATEPMGTYATTSIVGKIWVDAIDGGQLVITGRSEVVDPW